MHAEIQLTKGYVALIDEADLPIINKYKWHASERKNSAIAQTSWRDKITGIKGHLLMHRFLLNAQTGQSVDHINGNTLDNRRENIRIATAQENSWNSKARGVSGFKGVRPVGRMWLASIAPNDIEINLGQYDTPETAAGVYDLVAKIVYGEFARLNNISCDPALLEELIAKKRRWLSRIEQEIAILTGV